MVGEGVSGWLSYCALCCAVRHQGRWCVLPGSMESLMVLTRKLIKGITPPQAPPILVHLCVTSLRNFTSSTTLSSDKQK